MRTIVQNDGPNHLGLRTSTDECEAHANTADLHDIAMTELVATQALYSAAQARRRRTNLPFRCLALVWSSTAFPRPFPDRSPPSRCPSTTVQFLSAGRSLTSPRPCLAGGSLGGPRADRKGGGQVVALPVRSRIRREIPAEIPTEIPSVIPAAEIPAAYCGARVGSVVSHRATRRPRAGWSREPTAAY